MYNDLKRYKDNKVVGSEDLDQYLQSSRGLERDYMGELLKSRKMAWSVALGLGIVTLLTLVALMIAVKRDPAPPVVLSLDKSTGGIEVLTTLSMKDLPEREKADKFWLSSYVRGRESYDYDTMGLLYEQTALFSSFEVQKEYQELFKGADALQQRFKNNVKIFTKIVSITCDSNSGMATVRFTTQEKHSNGGFAPLRHFIATIAYKYIKSPLKESELFINPTGFQVTSYRVDPEIIGKEDGNKGLDDDDGSDNDDDEDN